MSQTQRLRSFLDKGKPITATQALSELGIARLAARVYDLRASGYPVEVSMRTVRTKYGKAKVAEYRRGRK